MPELLPLDDVSIVLVIGDQSPSALQASSSSFTDPASEQISSSTPKLDDHAYRIIFPIKQLLRRPAKDKRTLSDAQWCTVYCSRLSGTFSESVTTWIVIKILAAYTWIQILKQISICSLFDLPGN